MKSELKTTLDKAMDMARSGGADTADLILSKGESFSLSAQGGSIDKYKVSGSQILGIRVIKDSKVGLSFTESMVDDSIETMVKSAIENAKNSEVNEYESISVEKGELLDKSKYEKDTATTEEKIEFCLKLESEVKARNNKVQTVPYNGFSEGSGEKYYLNSNGMFTFESDYYQSCYTSALIVDGDKNSMHYHGVAGRSLKELSLEECVNESLTHAEGWLEGAAIKTGHYDIIFTNDILQSVMGCFSNIFSAKAALEKTNPFADKLGEMVAGSGFTITDRPQYKDAFDQSLFDSEGVAQKDLVLIENGKLNSFYHNTMTANFFKTKTTGHAARGARSGLGVGGTTRVVSAGSMSQDAILADEYFEVHALQGLHSGANSTSGDFSFAATGYMCRDGKRVKAVKGVTISGNFHKMLLDIKNIGNTIHSNSEKSFFSPTIRFEKMSVAGL